MHIDRICTPAWTAVSYTHLDVYKRQQLDLFETANIRLEVPYRTNQKKWKPTFPALSLIHISNRRYRPSALYPYYNKAATSCWFQPHSGTLSLIHI